MRSDLPDAATCERIFYAALGHGDVQGVDAALRILAVQDPQRAAQLFDLTKAALAVVRSADTSAPEAKDA